MQENGLSESLNQDEGGPVAANEPNFVRSQRVKTRLVWWKDYKKYQLISSFYILNK